MRLGGLIMCYGSWHLCLFSRVGFWLDLLKGGFTGISKVCLDDWKRGRRVVVHVDAGYFDRRYLSRGNNHFVQVCCYKRLTAGWLDVW